MVLDVSAITLSILILLQDLHAKDLSEDFTRISTVSCHVYYIVVKRFY